MELCQEAPLLRMQLSVVHVTAGLQCSAFFRLGSINVAFQRRKCCASNVSLRFCSGGFHKRRDHPLVNLQQLHGASGQTAEKKPYLMGFTQQLRLLTHLSNHPRAAIDLSARLSPSSPNSLVWWE